MASDEQSLSLPLHQNDLESLRPLLNFFCHLYGIGVVCTTCLNTEPFVDLSPLQV